MKTLHIPQPTIVIAGGTGFLGNYLTTYFTEKGYTVYVLSRNQQLVAQHQHILYWDGTSLGKWATALENAVAIINLAGRSVDCRYTQENKALILNSRINATKIIGKAIQQCKQPPQVWFNASSATIYQDTRGQVPANTELEGVIGDDFSMNVCQQWEQAFNDIATPKTRKLCLRIAITLGKGGAMTPLLNITKWGLGGKQGDGQQFVSWLHIEDLAAIIDFLLKQSHITGVINCVSPNAVTNQVFMHKMRKVCNQPIGLPTPSFLVKLGAVFLRTEAELVLKSRKVYPKNLLDEGYSFKFVDITTALEDIVHS